MTPLFIFVLRVYHMVSDALWTVLAPALFVTPRCRFPQTCSQYAAQALEQHGVVSGAYRACIRVLQCNGLYHG